MRKRYACQLASEGGTPTDTSGAFDENALTIGFARRFATYKRPNLLLHDTERLVRLLTNPRMPVQLILAGKAHPQDLPGQQLLKQWKDFIKRPEVKGRVVFLNDYDMMLAQELVQGIDLWINTPRRPWEACGTSGMKSSSTRPESIRVTAGGRGLFARSWLGHRGWSGNMATTCMGRREAEHVYALLEGK